MRAHLAIGVALAVHACLTARPAAAAGWAVGTSGTILKSVDGGTSWTAQNPTTAELRDLQFVDDSTGWAVGLNGTILKTTNGGTSWTASNPTTATLNSVCFISSTTGWAVGSAGTVLKTTNGGTSWTSTFPTTGTLNAVHFVDANTGWAVGTGGAIFKTTNGGTSWTGTFPSTATFNGVFFINSSTGWVVGSGGNVFRTTNGGATWIGTNPTTATLNGVAFVSTTTGWMVGTAGAIFKTTNGGTSWTSLNPVTATLNGVAFLDASTGWTAGSIGTVLKTTNAGGAWAASNPTGATLNAVQFVSVPTFVDVTVQTNPANLAIMVDGSVYVSTQTFSWLAGSSHTIATTTPQGARYVFASWSDGGAISHSVAPTVATTYTASFTRQYQLTMNAGAGGTVAPATGWYNAGSNVAIAATPNAGFSFGGWTGSGTWSYSGSNNPATITMNGSITETASFVANITVTVGSNPAGRSFSIDGTSYTSAQTLAWVPGQSHTLATTSPQLGAAGTRYVWATWTDGGALSHSVAPTTGTTYTASFTTEHQLTMLADAGGTVSPPSGWRAAGSSVAITATPDTVSVFGGWSGSGAGAYSGPDNPAMVTMNGPITQQAQFQANPTGVPGPMPLLAFALLPPSPNPSLGATQFAFSLPEPGPVALEVFDVRGRLVVALLNGPAPAGTHLCVWRGADSNGAPAANGVYVVRLRSAGRTQTQRTILMR